MKIKNLTVLVLTSFLGVLLFNFLFKDFSRRIYCWRQVEFKLSKFKLSVKQNGADQNIELNDTVKKFLQQMYLDCVKNK